MEQHWKLRDLGLTIVFSVIYFAVVLAATIMGGIHPLLYLFVTALIALVAWIPYMYVMAKVPKAGVVLIMNLSYNSLNDTSKLLVRIRTIWLSTSSIRLSILFVSIIAPNNNLFHRSNRTLNKHTRLFLIVQVSKGLVHTWTVRCGNRP